MADTEEIEFVVRTLAETVLKNETYFGDLDSVVGDGDFGYSLARGFEMVIAQWDSFDRSDAGTFLQKVAMTITSRIGGTSGPIWGTAFLRAAMVAKTLDRIDGPGAVAMLDAAIEGIKARGNADVGDKTLLDALVPMRDAIAADVERGASAHQAVQTAAQTARSAAEATAPMLAKRGRASYTGDRSIGSPDAGAVAVAVLAEELAARWPERPVPA